MDYDTHSCGWPTCPLATLLLSASGFVQVGISHAVSGCWWLEELGRERLNQTPRHDKPGNTSRCGSTSPGTAMFSNVDIADRAVLSNGVTERNELMSGDSRGEVATAI